jgi:hypothetical protein
MLSWKIRRALEAGMGRRLFGVMFLLAAQGVLMNAQPAPHAPDGGTRETLTSIAVPPLPNAPFSATVLTEWTKYFADGTTQFIQNHRRIARDSVGRVFQERATFGPKGSAIASQVWRTELAEPSTHTVAYCDSRTHVCELRPYVGPPATTPTTAGSPAPRRGLVTQNLGSQMMEGLNVIGSRETQSISQMVTGSDRPMIIAKEFWYSPQIGLNVFTTRDDPGSGKEVFTVTDIRLGEPDPALFTLPANMSVVDLRGTRSSSNR